MAKGWSAFPGGFCVDHTLELAVHKYTQADGIAPTFSRMRGIVGYFHKSTNGIVDLQGIQRRLSLPMQRPVQDVITRWRSSFDMVDWFRRQQQSIMTFDIERAQAVASAGGELGNLYGDNRLQLDDWSIAEQSVAVLATSANVTTKLEGTKYPTLSSVLPCVYRLLTELEDDRSLYMPWKPQGVEQFLRASALKPAVRAARAAFRKDLEERFVSKLPLARKETMAICTMLDPRFKQYNFTGATIPDAVFANTILKSTFENLWASMPLAPVPAEATAPSATETPTAAAAAASPTAAAAAEDNTLATAAAAPAATALTTARPDNSMSDNSTRLMLTGPAASTGSTSFADIFDRPMEEMEREMPPPPLVENDLEKYLKIPQLPLKNPDGTPSDILAWWRLRDHSLPADPQTGRPEGLPHLARMARQYHGEPASSAGAERLFSAASRAHHDLKGAMEDNSLEHQLLAFANTE